METETINKPVPVVLPISDWAALKKQAHDTGRSASAIVRDLVADHLRGDKSKELGRNRGGAA